MRYRTIQSILPMLTLTTGKKDMAQMEPELAQMVAMVERNLGLRADTLPRKDATIDIVQTMGDLPADFFQEEELTDACMTNPVPDRCSCHCSPCCCGHQAAIEGCGDFTFYDTTLQAPFRAGTASFRYWALVIDPKGLPMVPEDHIEAFVAFVSALLKKGEMNAGMVHPNVYKVNKEDWGEQSRFTRGRRVPTRKQIHTMDYITTHPFKFRLR